MTVRPRSRSELVEMTGVSSSTIRRTLRAFEKRGWIQRDEYRYETTELGSFVASAMADLHKRVETEQKLRGVWDWLPDGESGFTVEMCTDATITVADADNPYRPVNRFVVLLRETEELRTLGVDIALLEPCKDELCEEVVDGVRAELINSPRVARYIRSTCSELFSETFENGDLTVRIHDDLPSYSVSLFDDRVAISGYDPDSVAVRVLVDTDGLEAYEWAESLYESYRRETSAIPLETTKP